MRSARLVVVTGLLVAAVAAPVAGVALDAFDCDGCIDTGDLKADAVNSGRIAPGAVKTADVKARAITSGKLAKRAVERENIDNGAVGLNKLAPRLFMSARVDPNGSLVNGTNGVASQRIDDGSYQVTFPFDITECAVAATHTGVSGLTFGRMTATAGVGWNGDPLRVQVFLSNESTATFEDAGFSLIVMCA
jgi:hypothetical protein